MHATRDPTAAGIPDLDGMIEKGASPRASLYLTTAAKAHAFLQGRSYVTPHDVKTLALDVLRHRVVVTYEAEAEGKTSRGRDRADPRRRPRSLNRPRVELSC